MHGTQISRLVAYTRMGVWAFTVSCPTIKLVLAGKVSWNVPFTPQVAYVSTSECTSVLLWIMSFVTVCPLSDDAGESTQLMYHTLESTVPHVVVCLMMLSPPV